MAVSNAPFYSAIADILPIGFCSITGRDTNLATTVSVTSRMCEEMLDSDESILSYDSHDDSLHMGVNK